MEQTSAVTRPQTSRRILSAFGTFFILTLSFQLASIQPVHAAPSYRQQRWSLQPHELLKLYYNRAPVYKPRESNFVWQKRGWGRGPGSEFLGKRSGGYSINKRVPGSEFLRKRVPGSEFLGKRVPGSEFLGKRVPGSEFLGKRVPGSEFLGKRVPGSEFLGKRVPGSEFLGKRVPGSEFLGKRVPGSEFLGKRVPGSEFLGKRVPGSEFLGKRSNIDNDDQYDNLNPNLEGNDDDSASHLINLFKRSPEMAEESAIQSDRNNYEAEIDHLVKQNLS